MIKVPRDSSYVQLYCDRRQSIFASLSSCFEAQFYGDWIWGLRVVSPRGPWRSLSLRGTENLFHTIRARTPFNYFEAVGRAEERVAWVEGWLSPFNEDWATVEDADVAAASDRPLFRRELLTHRAAQNPPGRLPSKFTLALASSNQQRNSGLSLFKEFGAFLMALGNMPATEKCLGYLDSMLAPSSRSIIGGKFNMPHLCIFGKRDTVVGYCNAVSVNHPEVAFDAGPIGRLQGVAFRSYGDLGKLYMDDWHDANPYPY
jgi:hypothetical protein